MPIPNEIFKILLGLIILDAASRGLRTVQLAYLSVKEYLTLDSVYRVFKPSLEKLSAHIAIVDVCIAHVYNSYLEL